MAQQTFLRENTMRILKSALIITALLSSGVGQVYAETGSLTAQEQPVNSSDEAMELAYIYRGLNKISEPQLDKAFTVLDPYVDKPKVQALQDFLGGRSVLKALELISLADSPKSLAVAYMCLAEAQYAKGDTAKAMMAAVLSLAYDFSEAREQQARLYLTGSYDSDVSFRGTKQEIIDCLIKDMKWMINPRTFQRYYSTVSVLGLLPEFPYSPQLLTQNPTQPVETCIGFDGNYSYHGAVTILSAMLSANPSSRYIFHVPEDGEGNTPISESHKEQLRSLTQLFPEGRFKIAFETYSEDFLPSALKDREFRHWPRGILFKLYIPQFYSHLDKIMWLDSDLIIRSDLSPFYNEDMDGKWIMAVRDLDPLEHLPRVGLEKEDAYINAGVMLYDIAKLKGQDYLVEEYITTHVHDAEYFKYPEQDIYAVAYKGHIKEKGYQHWIGNKFYFEAGEWNWFYIPKHDLVRWENLHNHYAKIIHMAAQSRKPWNRKYSSLTWSLFPRGNDGVQNIYWALRNMGPWPN
jgi:lipopolysaccharide biosynthesis glycosyltransferase